MTYEIADSLTTLAGYGPRSLIWEGDELVDWVGGGARYGLDGSFRRAGVNYAFTFDGAVACGPYAVIFQRLGTKGLLLREGKVLRELNRSFYQAHVYDYPVCLFRTGAGRVLLSHCPEEYNRVEIDDAETGRRLTDSALRKPGDCFHSRLTVNPGGTRLMSAGWVWHPVDVVGTVELAQALEDPCALDFFPSCAEDLPLDEESSAVWLDDRRVLLAGTADTSVEPGVGHRLMVCDVPTRTILSHVSVAQPAGPMMAVGREHVLTFYQHPRLISLVDGSVVREWSELPTGQQVSSISWHVDPSPPLALDPQRARFAVRRGNEIVVVSLTLPGGER